jgi:hypothetical protein
MFYIIIILNLIRLLSRILDIQRTDKNSKKLEEENRNSIFCEIHVKFYLFKTGIMLFNGRYSTDAFMLAFQLGLFKSPDILLVRNETIQIKFQDPVLKIVTHFISDFFSYICFRRGVNIREVGYESGIS